MRGVDVYGVKVNKYAAEPAKQFMNMQFAWCGCSLVVQAISLILSIMVYNKFYEIVALLPSLPATAQTGMKTMESMHMTALWQINLSNMIVVAFVGTLFIYLARKKMADGNLNVFCCLEGCCSIWYGITACGMIGAFFFVYTAAQLIGNPQKICEAFNEKKTITTGDFSFVKDFLSPTVAPLANMTPTVAPLLAPGNVTTTLVTIAMLPEGSCEKALGAIKSIFSILTVYMAMTVCFTCIISCICGAGAKAANETQEAMDDADSSDLDYE
jgi:hypothetical protein